MERTAGRTRDDGNGTPLDYLVGQHRNGRHCPVGMVRSNRYMGVPAMSVAMRMRMRSSKRDARSCSCCSRDALYVMEMQSRLSVTITRLCQFHIDELRAMLGVEPIHVYPKEISNE